MAFDNLTAKLQNVFKGLRSKGRLTEADVKAALREVKMAKTIRFQTLLSAEQEREPVSFMSSRARRSKI